MRRPNGTLQLKAGGRLRKLLTIFYNPELPTFDDYYEPLTYEYEMLLNAPANSPHVPVARPKSLITGKDTKITWSANWDDSLAGSREVAIADPVSRR